MGERRKNREESESYMLEGSPPKKTPTQHPPGSTSAASPDNGEKANF